MQHNAAWKRFQLLSPAPPGWCRAIARYHLHKNRLAPDGKDPIERAWRDALRLLQQVADGKFALGAGDPVAVHKLDARFDSAPLVFGRKQLRSWR